LRAFHGDVDHDEKHANPSSSRHLLLARVGVSDGPDGGVSVGVAVGVTDGPNDGVSVGTPDAIDRDRS
jgi:hypothetical protein